MSRLASLSTARVGSAIAVIIGSALGAELRPVAAQEDIELAVSMLREEDRAGATVHQNQGGEWVTLREGTGTFVCLADTPGDDSFRATCYHKSLEPYMERGRALRAEGIDGRDNIGKRLEEIEAGQLEMPSYATLIQINGPVGWSGDPATVRRRTVIYVPGATAEDVGLPTTPSDGPWLMNAGTGNAHIMISG
ncbi:MAG: hypothetical protein MJB57_01215 [Gemmatimonadetes bacterium]|nr:hypothetical protein [Gemmatimonadota bacterium]